MISCVNPSILKVLYLTVIFFEDALSAYYILLQYTVELSSRNHDDKSKVNEQQAKI